MAPISLTKILTLAPLLISSALASISDVHVNRNDKGHVVHSLYQALGKNWALTDDDNGPRIKSVVLFSNKTDYDAWHHSSNLTQHMAPRKVIRDLDRVFHRRAIIGHPTDTTCVVKGSHEDQYWRTRAEQLPDIQKFCKALNSVNDEAFFFIGLIIGASACDGNLICNAVIGVGALEAGKYIGPQFGKFCNSIVGEILRDCGIKGGTTHVELNGKDYNVEAFETQEDGNICGGSNRTKCFSQTCGSNHCV
jgi:hypothetical protein